jgi:hypothetical protein
MSGFLLVGAVAVVGVLHTIVPDHWVPITLIARQRGWSQRETALAALQAGTGHVVSTLLIGLVVWFAGVAVATRFGHVVETASSIALIAFGGWIAISAWRELHGQAHGHSHGDHGHGAHGHGPDHGHGHGPDHGHGDGHSHPHRTAPENDPLYAPMREEAAILARHAHLHRHGQGAAHLHWHDHAPDTAHAETALLGAEPPLHVHRHKTTARTALLLILGSSPMVEGIPAFFAAGKYGIGLIAVMAAVFAVSTIATYLLLCVYSTAGLQRVRFGAFERYGEVMSGAFIALVGVAFWIWPVF